MKWSNCIPLGPVIQESYSSMHYVGRYITDMETHRCARLADIGKSYFFICDEYIATFDIVMLSEKQKIHLWLQYGTLPIDSFIPLGKEYITNEVLSHGM